MPVFHRFRTDKPLARRVLAIVGLAWLQMVAAPCVMALDVGVPLLAASTPNSHDAALVATPLVTGATPSHCDYCPAPSGDDSKPDDCVVQKSDCSYTNRSSTDGRDLRLLQLEKLYTYAALIDPTAFSLLSVLREPDQTSDQSAEISAARRSLNLENCVQLK